jgi:hypothetical protein
MVAIRARASAFQKSGKLMQGVAGVDAVDGRPLALV